MMTNNKTVLIITGSYPPDICGVGDYTARLYTELMDKQDLQVSLFYKSDWRLKNFFSYYKEIRNSNQDIIHLQYPTEGFGYSFLPFLLMLLLPKHKLVITVHEFSSRTAKAYLYTLMLLLASRCIIVTNEVERDALRRVFFMRKKSIEIINIGSNIPQDENHSNPFYSRETDIAYFGHIRPIKGIESFLNTIENIHQTNKGLNICLIGQKLSRYESFFREIELRMNELNVKLILNSSPEEVARYLANTKIVYLPFPDGVSERRGSLMAAAVNGCTLVSTYSKSERINNFFEKGCYLVNNEPEASSLIVELIRGTKQAKDTSFLKNAFLWSEIAAKHKAIYSNF